MFFLTIDLLSRDTQCKRNQLVPCCDCSCIITFSEVRVMPYMFDGHAIANM